MCVLSVLRQRAPCGCSEWYVCVISIEAARPPVSGSVQYGGSALLSCFGSTESVGDVYSAVVGG